MNYAAMPPTNILKTWSPFCNHILHLRFQLSTHICTFPSVGHLCTKLQVMLVLQSECILFRLRLQFPLNYQQEPRGLSGPVHICHEGCGGQVT